MPPGLPATGDIGLHPADQAPRRLLELADPALDRGGKLCGLGGQAADLVCHHGEPTGRLAAARRLDPGIEAKDLRLIGDLAERAGNPADRGDVLQEFAQLAFQPDDAIDQAGKAIERRFRRPVAAQQDIFRAGRRAEQFLRRHPAFGLIGGQRIHADLEVCEALRLSLDLAIELPQEAPGFAAVHRQFGGLFSEVRQQFVGRHPALP